MLDLKYIDARSLWYIIGYIAADGHLSKDGRHINITSKDEKHLIKIKNVLGLNVKIGKKARGGSKNKIYAYLQFGDVKFYRYLLSIGFVQEKSLKIGKIKVDKNYFNDFLRGVIDGDGSISTWIHKSNLNRQWSLRIVSAAPFFIKWLKKEIEKTFDIKGKIYNYIYKDKKNFIYILKFGKLSTKIILKGVYYNKCLSLNRKNKQSVICLQDENKMINYRNVLGPGAVIGSQDRLKIC